MTYYDRNYAAHLPDDLDTPILDIGCGQGDLVRYLVERGYRNITAVDIDREALVALAGLPGVTTIEAAADAAFMHSLDRSFGLIVAKQMIYYLPRTKALAFAQAMGDKLTGEGTLVVEIFNGSLISGRFTEIKDPFILTAYSEHSIRRLLSAAGLRIETVCEARADGSSLRSRLYRLMRRIWFALYRAILIIERGKDDELPRLTSKSLLAVARKA